MQCVLYAWHWDGESFKKVFERSHSYKHFVMGALWCFVVFEKEIKMGEDLKGNARWNGLFAFFK